MTYRVLVRRFANQQPYTWALCHSLSELDEALDLAELQGWPFVECEELKRPGRLPVAIRAIEKQADPPATRMGLWAWIGQLLWGASNEPARRR